MVQSLQTGSNRLKGKFNTLEEDTTNLTNKTQSMTEGAETLSGRNCTVECINQTLLKGCDRLTDKMSLKVGNMHPIKTMFKDETLSLLDRCHTLKFSMRALEQNIDLKIQTLQKAVTKRFEKIKEFIEFDYQVQKVQRQNVAS